MHRRRRAINIEGGANSIIVFHACTLVILFLCYTCQVLTSSSVPVYHKIFVNTSGSQSQRVTFDACEGSNEHHYWDHHAGSTEPHTTGLCIILLYTVIVHMLRL